MLLLRQSFETCNKSDSVRFCPASQCFVYGLILSSRHKKRTVAFYYISINQYDIDTARCLLLPKSYNGLYSTLLQSQLVRILTLIKHQAISIHTNSSHAFVRTALPSWARDSEDQVICRSSAGPGRHVAQSNPLLPMRSSCSAHFNAFAGRTDTWKTASHSALEVRISDKKNFQIVKSKTDNPKWTVSA